MPNNGRRFTEKQSSAILRRAAQLQGDAAEKPIAAASVEELRQAAQEMGIQPAYFDAAVRELDVGSSGGAEQEKLVSGALDDVAWEDLIADARRTFGTEGKTTQRGETREWIGEIGGLDVVTIVARPQGDGVRLTVSCRTDNSVVVHYVLSVIPFLIGVAFLVEALREVPAIALAAALLWMAVVVNSARTLANASTRKRYRQATEFLARAEERLATAPQPLSNIQPSEETQSQRLGGA